MKNLLILPAVLLISASCNQFAPRESEFGAFKSEQNISNSESIPQEQVPPSTEGSLEGSSEVLNPAPAPTPSTEVVYPTPVVQPPAQTEAPAPAPAPSEPAPAPAPSEPAPAPAPSAPTPTPAPVPVVTVPDSCNDMSNEVVSQPLPGTGLMARIYDGSRLGNVTSFSQLQSKGILLSEELYLPHLNFSRAQHSGFPKPAGGLVLNSLGKPIMNKYGLLIETNLSLLPDDEEGYYQISAIHDDGLVVEANVERQNKKPIIDSDNLNPTKYSCSLSTLIKMERNKVVPITLKYFQGTSKQTALILMWRKVKNSDGSLVQNATEKDLHEIRCGQAGNHFFFDSTAGIHPTMDYKDLLNPEKRVIPWKVVKSGNNKLHSSVNTTSCIK